MNIPISGTKRRVASQSFADFGVPNPQAPYNGLNNKSISFCSPARKSHKLLAIPSISNKIAPINNPNMCSTGQLSAIDSIKSSKSSSHNFMQVNDRYLRHEQVLEAFLVNTMTCPLHEAIEHTIEITLNAESVTLWQDIPTLHVLYSEKINKVVTHSSGIIGFGFFAREVVKIPIANQHPAFNQEFDSNLPSSTSPVLLFPLWDSHDNVCAIVEVTKNPKDPFFDDEDDDFIQFFIKKFKIYSHWLLTPKPRDNCLELMQVMELEQYLLLFQRKLSTLFECYRCELWRYDLTQRVLTRFTNTVTKIDPKNAGIVGEALVKECPINIQVNKMQSSYNEEVDGNDAEPVLVVPLIDIKQNAKFAVALRGRKNLPIFTQEDEAALRQLAPYFILALDNSEKFSQNGSKDQRNQVEHLCASSLAKITEMLSEGASINKIIEISVEKAGLLTNADRCYVFTYHKELDVLQTIIATGLKPNSPPLEIAADRGLVGKSYQEGKVFNIPDAYEDLIFDSTFDLTTNYRTKTIISVPVVNNRKQVIAVAQFLNKRDGKPFSNIDLGYINLFMAYCGLIMENEYMYQISSTANAQLRSFINVSLSLSSTQNVKAILSDIMQNARKIINAERASLFILDDTVNVLSSYLVDGGSKMPVTIPLSHGIAATTAKTKESIMVNDAYHDPRFNKMIDYHTGFITKSILTAPLTSSEGRVIGVAEMINKNEGDFTKEDQNLLNSLATFAAMSLEEKRLKDITERGNAEIEMSKWIGDYERKSYIIPQKLQIPMNKQSEVTSINFFCIEWNGIGLFKVAFFIFNQFSLLEKFQISNELFFTFLYKLREEYNEPPYHNWIHAIDVLQYFIYQLRKANFDNILTAQEILSICIAAIAHDAGHQGYNNVYNENAQTPLGILFKDHSVMETHHCTVIIRVISQDECNIFHALPEPDLKKIWNWIIQMILATDMAHHFKLVKNANDIMDEGPINLANEKHRMMAMTILMKVSDISNVSRPFEIAEQWCDVLSEEFWRQGDMEKAQGMEFSSPLNDRTNNNRPKGQIGFYNFICLPLYQAISRIFPELECNVEFVRENLEIWKQNLAEQERQEQLAKLALQASESARSAETARTSRSVEENKKNG